MQWHGCLLPSQDHIVDQRADPFQRIFPPVNLHLLDGLLMPKYAVQTAQPQDMAQVTMSKQDAPEMSKFSFRFLDLVGSAFAAAHQKVEIVVLYDDRRKPRAAEGTEADVPKNNSSNKGTPLGELALRSADSRAGDVRVPGEQLLNTAYTITEKNHEHS